MNHYFLTYKMGMIISPSELLGELKELCKLPITLQQMVAVAIIISREIAHDLESDVYLWSGNPWVGGCASAWWNASISREGHLQTCTPRFLWAGIPLWNPRLLSEKYWCVVLLEFNRKIGVDSWYSEGAHIYIAVRDFESWLCSQLQLSTDV